MPNGDIFESINLVSVLTRLTLVVMLGGILGFERGRKRRPAGLRTYMIVCLASALVMITGEYLVERYQTGDPARLGAQVISGIGFLGAGTIIITSKQVKGLTTAAGLWASACLGLAVGAGFYMGSVLTGIFLLLIMSLMQKIDRYLCLRSNHIHFFAEFKTMESMGNFIQQLREMGCQLDDLEVNSREGYTDYVGATFWVKMDMPVNHIEAIQKMSGIKGVKYLEELEYM
ncbi:MAG: MgtC/SapB family protein [Hungatella sp.]|jgi:putative Mg2+ transporter-C (MgtC) family protein|nr:MgtC/SapB family protein [Hungatella sp.]